MQTTLPASRSATEIAAQYGIDLGHELTKGLAASVIRQKARQLVRRAGFSKSDLDDIKQQLVQHVLENLPSFDPEQGHFNAFVTTLIERGTANILREARAEMRDHREARSLNTIVGCDEDGPIELGDTVLEGEAERRHCRAPRNVFANIDLAVDLETAIAKLPTRLRDTCDRLQHKSFGVVARELGVRHSTLRRRINLIRRLLRKSEFGKSFQNSGAISPRRRVVN